MGLNNKTFASWGFVIRLKLDQVPGTSSNWWKWGATSVIPAVVVTLSAMHRAGRIRIILYCSAERTNTKEDIPRTYYWTTAVRRRGCISMIFENVLGLSCFWYVKNVLDFVGCILVSTSKSGTLVWRRNLHCCDHRTCISRSGIEESARTLLVVLVVDG